MAKPPKLVPPVLSSKDRKEADKVMEAFLHKLEALYKNVPEDVIRLGAERVTDFLKGKLTVAEIFNITPDMERQIVAHGYLMHKSGRYEDADRFFRVLTFLNWENPYYHSMRGSILQHLKKYGDAIAEYSESIRLNPNDIVSFVNRGEIFMLHDRLDYARGDFEDALKCKDVEDPKWIARAKSLLEKVVKKGGK